MSTPRRIYLAAEDREDLDVLGAMLQDAVVRVGDMTWSARARRFALVANRFRWEGAADSRRRTGERVRCGLQVDGVRAVAYQGFTLRAADQILALLTLNWQPDDAGGTLTLVFAGGAAIRLQAEAIAVELRDLSDPWPARSRPNHEGAQRLASPQKDDAP
ncbi:DUF2948 family protein [Zavarzinia sp. CC-PAN008]|uniref:DUF2948 family protein n=1 Tax=Zavarzinia sp. CC-PAN008 TaxID=3243332 RepID=UPI003F748445